MNACDKSRKRLARNDLRRIGPRFWGELPAPRAFVRKPRPIPNLSDPALFLGFSGQTVENAAFPH